jgi:tetratricopeptide (TPR) repeat protein
LEENNYSMRILLFNLGTIENRIFDWGIEGFQSLFEQDIILWGPIPDKIFVYNNKEIPILGIFESTTVSEVFNKLPKDWYPDIVTCDTSVLNYIPDIYKCPVKTILFTRDSWSDTVFNKKLVELFDFVNHATVDRPFYKSLNINLLPVSNFAVSIPPPDIINSLYEKREIDVIAIANYDTSFYHDRYKTLYRLSASNDSGIKIKYFKGIKRPEIYSYYQRSKIVIDWSHTLSNRSYEAALNGCLLFSHTDNALIKEFWTPWKEYIPYDDSNVLELIKYYIKNPEEAKKIISRSVEKIKKSPASWGAYVWENITIAHNTLLSVEDRIKRNESTHQSVLYYLSATPLVYNYDYNTYFPADWKELYFKRIDLSLSCSPNPDDKISPLIEAARLSFLLKKYDLSLKYFNELEKIIPDYAWIYHFQARISLTQNNTDQALKLASKAIECGQKSPGLLRQFILPVIEKGNPCDGRRVTNFLWQPVYNHDNEFQTEALLQQAFELTGDIFVRINDINRAIEAYSSAINYLPVPDCFYKLNPLLIQKGDFETLMHLTYRGIDNSPYDNILILYEVYALIQIKQKMKAIALLKSHRDTLRSFIGIRKFKKLRTSISLIRIFILINRWLSSKIIIELIVILKEKARII